MDVQAIAGLLMTAFQARIAGQGFSPGTAFGLDNDEMNRRLAKLPSEPDEKLR